MSVQNTVVTACTVEVNPTATNATGTPRRAAAPSATTYERLLVLHRSGLPFNRPAIIVDCRVAASARPMATTPSRNPRRNS
jgi:hypothetical protein